MTADEDVPSSVNPNSYSSDLHASVSAIALSPDAKRLVVAGRDIFQIIRVEQTQFTIQHDVRAAIRGGVSVNAGHQGSTVGNNTWDKVTIQDAKWLHGTYGNKIATAAANGQVVLYDVNSDVREWSRLHKHHRQVHRLGVNPIESGLLLSSSQDSTIRLWDLRIQDGQIGKDGDGHEKSVCFYGNSGPVRDVQWSPVNFHDFAAATDGGTIQKWDIRKPGTPVLRVPAHERPCNSIDWHPDGRHVLSAGADKDIKVWDFNSSDRRIKAIRSLRAPQAITCVRWQPSDIRKEGEIAENWSSTLVAACFDQEDARILFWDWSSPKTPRHVLYREENAANCLLWQTRSVLWSADGRGVVTRHEVLNLPTKPEIHAKCLSAFRADGVMTQLSVRSKQTDGEDIGLETASSKPFVKDQSSEPETEDELDLSSSITLTRRTQASDLKIAEICVDKRILDFTSENYRPVSQLPFDVSSAEEHIDFEATMLYNADIAAQVSQMNRSNHWKYLALIGGATLEARARSRRRQKGQDEAHSRFQLADFLPTTPDERVGSLPSMRGLMARLIDDTDRTIGHSEMVAYILLNIFPWFPLHNHPCSHQTVRDNIIYRYHDWLCRLGLYTAACSLRKCWARVSPHVTTHVGAANVAPARLFCTACQKVIKGTQPGWCDRCSKLLFVCAYCHLRRPEGLWFWCQQCGHGGHLDCMKRCFFETAPPLLHCPKPGCGCKCAPGK